MLGGRTPVRAGCSMQRYPDRTSAGIKLGETLRAELDAADVVVLALPRGGVPVGYEVSLALEAPLDILVVRKLGAPFQPELAIGAIAPDGVRVLNHYSVSSYGISPAVIDEIEAQEREELARRQGLYRKGLPPLDVKGKCVVLVDDGLATGATMQAAVEWTLAHGCGTCVVAVPVASAVTCVMLERYPGVRCICLATPEPFYAVGEAYRNFDQVSDDEVITIMAERSAELRQAGEAKRSTRS